MTMERYRRIEMIRDALATTWPDVRWTCRLIGRPGESRTRVAWADGPDENEVRGIVYQYEGRRLMELARTTTTTPTPTVTAAVPVMLGSGATISAGAVLEVIATHENGDVTVRLPDGGQTWLAPAHLEPVRSAGSGPESAGDSFAALSAPIGAPIPYDETCCAVCDGQLSTGRGLGITVPVYVHVTTSSPICPCAVCGQSRATCRTDAGGVVLCESCRTGHDDLSAAGVHSLSAAAEMTGST